MMTSLLFFPGWGPAGSDPGRVKVMNKLKELKAMYIEEKIKSEQINY